MSGGFGWSGGSSSHSTYNSSNDAFDAYGPQKSSRSPGPSKVSQVQQLPVIVSGINKKKKQKASAASIDLSATKKLSSPARDLVLVVLDMTGSMGHWRAEIQKKMSTLHGFLSHLLNPETEILVMAYGDLAFGDELMVTEFCGDQRLESLVAALDRPQRGGGNMMESAEMMAYYIDQMVKFPNARNVFAFFVTDEAPYPKIDSHLVQRHMDILDSSNETTREVFQRLLLKMEVFCIFSETDSYYPSEVEEMRQAWRDALNSEVEDRVLPLKDPRRVVEVMAGAISKKTNQVQSFSKMLNQIHAGTRYGTQNIQTVTQSIALVGGKPKQLPPGKLSKPLF